MDNPREPQPAFAGGGSAAEAPRLFVRQSSGLIREFSVLDVVVINLVGLNPGIVAALGLIAVASLWPGASLIPVVIMGSIVSVATVVTYGLMSAAMPRAGGDYVFVGRSVWPWLGFLANWMMTWSLFVLLGLFSVGTITLALGPALTAFGYVMGSSAVVNMAETLQTNKAVLAAVSLALMVSVIVITLLGDRWVKYAFRVLMIVGLVGIGLALVVLLLTDQREFVANMNQILSAAGGGTVQGMRDAANQAGFRPVSFSWGATISALPFAFYAYVGVTYTTYLGGEIRRPQKNQPLGMSLALLIGTVFYVLFGIGLYKTFGWDNIHAWAYLASSDPEAIAFPGGAVFGSFLMGALSNNGLLSFLIGLSFFSWFYMILLFAVIMPIRNLFAWAMDRLLPDVVTRVNTKGTPYVATIIVGLGAIAITFVALFSDFLSLVVNYTLMYSTTFLLAGIAAAAFPYTRPDLFTRAPQSVRRRIGPFPLLSIAGVVQTLVFAVIIFYALRTPAYGGPVGRGALTFIVLLLVSGPVFFYASRAIRRSQGIDMDAAWRVLPPD
jgi:APA family basic amino acid/polyamine antiporter